MRSTALFVIAIYRTYISPYKGFCCAYRVQTGRGSCSALGYRAVRRYGLWPGYAVLKKRFAHCAVAYDMLRSTQAVNQQRGFVDCDLPCDLPTIDCGPTLDVLACCDFGDCSGRSSRRKDVPTVDMTPAPQPRER